MLYILAQDELVYVNVHFAQTFESLFLDSSRFDEATRNRYALFENKGIYQKTLTQSTVEKMHRSLEKYTQKIIFMEMMHIDSMEGNGIIEFSKLMRNLVTQNNNSVIVNNVGRGLSSELKRNIDNSIYNEWYNDDTGMFDVIITNNNVEEKIDVCQKSRMVEEIFWKKLQTKISECCENQEIESPSSRVKLNKYINIKKMMMDFSFFCFCVYRLALKMVDNKLMNFRSPNENQNIALFIHNMNSVVIGTIIAQMFCVDLVLVDHLGPYNKIYVDDLSRTIDYKKKYLVVCDVVCMGTELSNAKTILDVLGIQYGGSIALVDVVPVGTESVDMCALYVVDKDNNEIGYEIITDL